MTTADQCDHQQADRSRTLMPDLRNLRQRIKLSSTDNGDGMLCFADRLRCSERGMQPSQPWSSLSR